MLNAIRRMLSPTRIIHPCVRLTGGDKASPFHRARIPLWLLATAAILALAAITNPTCTREVKQTIPATPNIALVLDMSGSMEAADWPDDQPPPKDPTPESLPPTRLATAKNALRDFLNNRPPSQVALIAFARRPYLICPLMAEHTILDERLDQLETIDFEDGTSIGPALMLAIRSLKSASGGPKVIILFSDGVDHAQDHDTPPATCAKMAKQEGIAIHTVGIGGTLAFHPVATDKGVQFRPVGEKLDEEQLRTIARLADGNYHQAADANALVAATKDLARQMDHIAETTTELQAVALAPMLLLASIIAAVAAIAAKILLRAYA